MFNETSTSFEVTASSFSAAGSNKGTHEKNVVRSTITAFIKLSITEHTASSSTEISLFGRHLGQWSMD